MEGDEKIEKHDPMQYEFIRRKRQVNSADNALGPDGVYFYSKRIEFKPGSDYVPIYRTNMQIYTVANYVDGVASTLALTGMYKIAKQTNLYM